MSDFFRVFVEKISGQDNEAQGLQHDLSGTLGISSITGLRIINIYEVTEIDEQQLQTITDSVFAEKQSDKVYRNFESEDVHFAVEFLPGQFDQRADSASQCIHLIYPEWKGVVRSSKIILLKGSPSDSEIDAVKKYCINPVEAREKDLSQHSLFDLGSLPDDVPLLDDFNTSGSEIIKNEMGLAMSVKDIEFCQDYFQNTEKRAPSETEIRVLDTYWSDHCRHTTFETEISKITIPKDDFQNTLQKTIDHYLKIRSDCGRETKAMTLMDMATISGRRQRKDGILDDMEVSEEINACSVRITVDVDGVDEPWLLMFKNETHNHPTEIEPYGGASTCIGGAIRDPLSGRSYVYQAMRITGASDPRESLADTMAGKLPQKYITRTAAHGYSSYGNQIGLATSFVKEIYHPGYKAKRMEVGAVVAAVPERMVRRESPSAGDVIILIGGKTGRDGCGGATGSSKEHSVESLQSCSAEVQKGNAPEERKIQRLFRNPELTALIKKCNDFGAGGVSVAIGELSPGLIIDLDKVPVKYNGLNGTELAISESQERMAVVVAPEDKDTIITLAARENLDASHVADVTEEERLILRWRGKTIVDLSRQFLDTNGVRQSMDVELPAVDMKASPLQIGTEDFTKESYLNALSNINTCSQKGLVEMFDSTVGAGTVQMPFGGKNQLTEAESSIHKLPVAQGKTNTCSLISYGFDPEISSWSPYHGSIYAVVTSLTRILASGGRWSKSRLSFQEYFKRLGQDTANWGLPYAALLGALQAQESLNIPAIGGKDSMSGSFHELHVPPTLISFAVSTAKIEDTISSEFKSAGNTVYCLPLAMDDQYLPDWDNLISTYNALEMEMKKGHIKAVGTVKEGGIAAQVFRMAIGNGIGFKSSSTDLSWSAKYPGALIFESSDDTLEMKNLFKIGSTVSEEILDFNGVTLTLDEALSAWQKPLDSIFTDHPDDRNAQSIKKISYDSTKSFTIGKGIKPQVFLPVFPGTNCEYDTEAAFQNAGAATKMEVFRNRSRNDILSSLDAMVDGINQSQILMLSGGFSAGDEPEGSGKFIANVLRNPEVKAAVHDLLERDGLILGICNGFQALIKSGLLPYGQIQDLNEQSPTLARNINNRHISRIASTRVCSNMSPWLMNMNTNDVHEIAISHGEGRFTASEAVLNDLEQKGQIAFQYCDSDGNPSMNPRYNPNGSDLCIEGISSECGRILGKMGHTERFTNDNLTNIYGNKYQPLFESGVKYFK